MSKEEAYNPFVTSPSPNISTREFIDSLGGSRTYVISETLVNKLISENVQESVSVKKVGNNTIVGEMHSKRIPENYQDGFLNSLDAATVIIVEGLYSEGCWTKVSNGGSFSDIAESHAKSQGKLLISLNLELNKYYRTRSAMWREKGIINTEKTVPILECLDLSTHYLLTERKPPSEILERLED